MVLFFGLSLFYLVGWTGLSCVLGSVPWQVLGRSFFQTVFGRKYSPEYRSIFVAVLKPSLNRGFRGIHGWEKILIIRVIHGEGSSSFVFFFPMMRSEKVIDDKVSDFSAQLLSRGEVEPEMLAGEDSA